MYNSAPVVYIASRVRPPSGALIQPAAFIPAFGTEPSMTNVHAPLKGPGGSGPSSASRFHDLLDALRQEYELHVGSDSAGGKMSLEDYEARVQHQMNDMAHMQKTVSDLERAFVKMKQDYEEEISRLKRGGGGEGEETSRFVLPNGNGQAALSGLFATVGEKRSSSAAALDEPVPSVRVRETGGAIGDIAAAAATQNAPLAASTYDWLVVYNPKVPRAISLELAHSFPFEGVVCCVKFSGDGRLLAVSGNKLCVIYSVADGQRIAALPHDSADGSDLYVRSLSFSPDGTLLATGSEDNLIRLFAVDSSGAGDKPSLVRTLAGHEQDVYSLEFVDGTTIVSGSGDQTVRIWDVASGECRRTIAVHGDDSSRESGVTSIAVSHSRRFVAAGSLDRLVRVWDIEGGGLVETFEGHADSVYSVIFDRDDCAIISGSLDRSIRRWDFDRDRPGFKPNTCLQVIGGHKDFVLSVAVADGGEGVSSDPTDAHRRWVVSGSKDRSVQFWDPVSGSAQLSLQGHKNSVISVAMSPLGRAFATGSGDCRARIWTFVPTAKAE